MAASINDKFTEVRTTANAVVTTVSSSRSVGGSSLSCVDLSDWPTNTAVHFITYKKTAAGLIDKTTQCDWKGIVSGNTIGSLTLKNGTDAGNDPGDFVEAAPTGAWGEDLAEGLLTEHNADGTHGAITSTNAVLTTPSVKQSATGQAAIISATGTDTNIDLKLTPKGTGSLKGPGGQVWQYLGSAQITSNFTTTSSTATQVTGLTVTVTIPTGTTKIKVSFQAQDIQNDTAGSNVKATLWDGTIGSGGTQIGACQNFAASGNTGAGATIIALPAVATGSKTYNVGLQIVGGATAKLEAGTTYPAILLVECC